MTDQDKMLAHNKQAFAKRDANLRDDFLRKCMRGNPRAPSEFIKYMDTMQSTIGEEEFNEFLTMTMKLMVLEAVDKTGTTTEDTVARNMYAKGVADYLMARALIKTFMPQLAEEGLTQDGTITLVGSKVAAKFRENSGMPAS